VKLYDGVATTDAVADGCSDSDGDADIDVLTVVDTD
jgi:hypothetical protein